MKSAQMHMSYAMRILYLGAVAWSCTPTLAATEAASADAAARYQRERAMCDNGPPNQDRAACLRDADAAYAQMRKNGTKEPSTSYEQNALQRCEALPNDDRKACQARMKGQGSTSGSVASGGIYRELVVTEPAAPAAATPAGGTPPQPK